MFFFRGESSETVDEKTDEQTKILGLKDEKTVNFRTHKTKTMWRKRRRMRKKIYNSFCLIDVRLKKGKKMEREREQLSVCVFFKKIYNFTVLLLMCPEDYFFFF